MKIKSFEAILRLVLVTSVLFYLGDVTIVRAADNSRTLCSDSVPKDCSAASTICLNDASSFDIKGIPTRTKHIKFREEVQCDSQIKVVLDHARRHGITIEGTCADPGCFAGQQLCNLRNDFVCEPPLKRNRRDAADPEINEGSSSPYSSGPDGIPVLPCDFESGFCQWYQLSDSDFKWTRNKGKTPSSQTGPSGDYPSGNGYYAYIETSIPRKTNDKARLVSPTLRPVGKNQTCDLTFYIHMYGNSIGQFNVYQAPVVGHDIIKKKLTVSQGNTWVRENVTFDSEREFQVILEGVRGVNYLGDIAIDHISFSSGCQRLEPTYLRIASPSFVELYNNGTWGRVCNSGWAENDSKVACKELGYESVSKAFGSPMDSHMMDGYAAVTCSGSEKSIDKCTKTAWSTTLACSNNLTASLQCTGIAPVCPLKTHFYCPKKANESMAKCISLSQRCDFVNDCWDGSDETNCDNYTRCTFEPPNLCDYIQAENDDFNWTRNSGDTPSYRTGPSADHNGDKSKHYLYAEVSRRSHADKARIAVIPRFKGNHEGQCKVRFFYHMLGWSTGKLRILVSDIYTTHTVWEKVGSHGDKWIRAEVTLINVTRSFQVIFEAEHSEYGWRGDIAFDDVSFTPECRPAEIENITCSKDTFKCRNGIQCIPKNDVCDFKTDCMDRSDELNCGFGQTGRCNFEGGFCDWKNETDDVFDWKLISGSTLSQGTGPSFDHTLGYGKNGRYIYIEASLPRKKGDIARLEGPQYMFAGISGCQMRFFYHMWSIRNYHNVGTLKVILRNAITRKNTTLWQKTGNQGDRWIVATVPIATNWSVAQIVLEASVGLSFDSDIAIDDISFSPRCYPDTPAHIDKNYAVRLAGLKSSFEGRVEVYRAGYWGTVCSDGWDFNDAKVVCKQLGYAGATVVSIRTLPGKGQIWLDNLKCFGNESNLNMCEHNGWSVHDCNHNQDASVVCDVSGGNTIPLRLAGHKNNSRRGLVEVYKYNIWGLVCYDEWDLHDAHVACRQAGFLGVEGVTKETASTSNKIWLSKVSCRGNENSLGECGHSGWGAVNKCQYGYAGVLCKDQGASEGVIRLVGGRSMKEGRVEIFHNGEWGTVCEEKWGYKDAQVVCYELGFSGVNSYYQSFGPGTGRIWLSSVECDGTETSLSSCPRSPWGYHPCDHNEDVGVICGDSAYVGCYKDGQPHAMPLKVTMQDLTPVKCLRYCREKGFDYSGLHWGTECFCGNHYHKYGNASENECATPCVGDPTKICGGTYRLSVFATNPAILPSSAPGWLPVRQSCSSVVYIGSYAILNPISSPSYFSGNLMTGYIWSPSWPNKYPNKIHCVWVLNLQPGSKARIKFVSFNTEKHYDYFDARDGKRQYSTRLTPRDGFSGNFSYTLTASTNVMWLRFYADQSVSMTGFKLQYEATGLTSSTTPSPTTLPVSTTINPSSLPYIQRVIGGCNGKLHTVNVTFGYFDHNHNTGYVQSPGYPASYASNEKCNWTIVVQTGFQINVRIVKLNFASSRDFFAIDDGKTTQTSRDNSLPWSFKSRDRMLRVSFVTSLRSRSKRNVEPVGFYLKYERVYSTSTEPVFYSTTPASTTEKIDSNGSSGKQKEESDKLSGGSIAGIVIGFIVLSLIIIILVFLLIKNKKKRNNPAGRHFFINQAYDNTDGMVMTNPATGPTPPSGLQDATIFYANTAVAPPPYTPQADTTDPAPAYAVPTAPNTGYGNLYSQPPPYRASADRNATSTGIGSVTNLRDSPSENSALPATTVKPDDILRGIPALVSRTPVLTPVDGLASADGNPFGVKTVLPPIAAAAPQEKRPINGDEAGPLPEKVPIDVMASNNNNTDDQPPTSSGPLQGHVTRSQASTDFDVEVPFEFICPLSNNIMTHPVSASDGYTYERRAIKSWFRRNRTSPMTNERLTDLSYRPNEHLEARIKEFIQAHKV